jgi:hypothetical protein
MLSFSALLTLLDTPKGKAEINYALASLPLIGMGVFFLYSGVRARRKNG